MRILISAIGAAVLLAGVACQTVGLSAARDLDAKVFDSDRSADFKEVWTVDKKSGERLEPLLEGQSEGFTIRFSPSKAWLVVEDRMFDTLTVVRLFHHEPTGGFRRIPEEDFLLPAWNAFLAENEAAGQMPPVGVAKLHRWEEGKKTLVLALSATLADGRQISGQQRVDLSVLE